MRGLTKGQPPPNVSRKGQPAGTLAEWAEFCTAGLVDIADDERRTAYARNLFDDMNKSLLRKQLFEEQRYLCVFCERRIGETTPPLEPLAIDHWHPLSGFLEHAFTWDNLHVSCRFRHGGEYTCDDHKKDRALNLPWPVAFRYEDVLGFTSGGRMYVRKDVAIDDTLRTALAVALDEQPGPPRVASTLNLNHPALRAAREAAIVAVEEDIAASPTVTPHERRQRVTDMLAKSERDEFVSARVAVWSGQLGVGRVPP